MAGKRKNQETYREFLCPQCGEWGELDGEQLRGIVSTHHDTEDGGCGYGRSTG